MFLTKKLLKLNPDEEPQNNSESSIKVVKLCINLLKLLSISFCRLAESKKLEEPQTLLAHYYAMQLIGYCLYSYALLHEAPSTSLWKKAGELYKAAIKTNNLEERASCKIQEFKPHTNIASALKRNILFSICNPAQYTNNDIHHLFQLCNHYFNLLEIDSTSHAGSVQCYWNQETEPRILQDENKNLSKTPISIALHHVVQALQLGKLNSEVEPAVIAKLSSRLTGYKQIYSSIIFGLTTSSHLLLGFNVISDYLKERDKLAKIQQHGKSVPIDMSLIPLDQEKKHYNIKNLLEPDKLPGVQVTLLSTGNKSYAVIKNCSINALPENLILLCKQQQQPTLAIIRNKSSLDTFDNPVILLEYIPGNLSINTFSQDSDNLAQVLVLGEKTSRAEVFLPVGKYAVGNKIMLNNRKVITLLACIEYNSYFYRYRINFDS